jgi:hypothetical protein
MVVNAIGAAWMQIQSITSSQWPKVDWILMTILSQLVANAISVSVTSYRMSSSWNE